MAFAKPLSSPTATTFGSSIYKQGLSINSNIYKRSVLQVTARIVFVKQLAKLLFGGQRPLAISLPTPECIRGRASPGDEPER